MDIPRYYIIRIQGHLSETWSTWFEGFSIRCEADGTTVIEGLVVDQAALHGILMKIRDLGLQLISVNETDIGPTGDPSN